MSGTTPVFKWATPQSSDKIAQIADILAGSITAIENQFYVAQDSKSVADGYNTYPLGISQMALTTTGATNGAWPGSTTAIVVTFRRGTTGDAAAQLWIKNTATTPQMQLRCGNANGWSDWLMVASGSQPIAEATGQVTGTPPSGGGTIAIPVTFPSGRFTSFPRVMVSINASTKPVESACSVSNLTSGGCTIYLYRTNPTATSIAWHAIQGVDL